MAKRKNDGNGKAEDVKVEKYSTSLRVVLTPDEIADRADRAAQKLAERDSKEEEMKAAAKHAKGVIEMLEAELRQLSTEVRTRSTYAPVECERRYDYRAKTYTEVRLDTDETLTERPLTETELQRDLAFAE